MVEEQVGVRLRELDARLGDVQWLDGAFLVQGAGGVREGVCGEGGGVGGGAAVA